MKMKVLGKIFRNAGGIDEWVHERKPFEHSLEDLPI